MKYLILFPFLIFLFLEINLFGQTVAYTYDANGNRLTRTLTVEQLRSQGSSLPESYPEFLAKYKDIKDMKTNEITSEDEEIRTIVYPNPNQGIMYINIINMPLSSKNEMRLYDLSGTELFIKKDFDSFSEINISNYKDGTYILRIRVNQILFYWKVIKSSY